MTKGRYNSRMLDRLLGTPLATLADSPAKPNEPQPCPNCIKAWRCAKPQEAIGFCHHRQLAWHVDAEGALIVEHMTLKARRLAQRGHTPSSSRSPGRRRQRP